MTELEMTTEAEVEDFTDELSDEALDRAEGAGVGWSAGGCSGCAGAVRRGARPGGGGYVFCPVVCMPMRFCSGS